MKAAKVLIFTDVMDLRKVVDGLKSDHPHLPLLLELVISGMSRTNIANLTVNDVKDGKIKWQIRRNDWITTEFGERQMGILQEYLDWRKKRSTKNEILLLVKKSSKVKNFPGYYFPIKAERVRSDIRFVGRELDLFGLEIPAIHDAIAEYLLSRGADKKWINKRYKKNY